MIAKLKRLMLPDHGSLFSILLKRTMPISVLALSISGIVILNQADNTRLKKVGTELTELDSFGKTILKDRLDSIIRQSRNLAESSLVVNGLIDHEGRDYYMPPFFRSLKIASPAAIEVTLADYRGRTLYQNIQLKEEALPVDQWLPTVVDDGNPFFFADHTQIFIAYPVLYSGLPEGALITRISRLEMNDLFKMRLTNTDYFISTWENAILSGSGNFNLPSGTAVPVLNKTHWISRTSRISDQLEIDLTIMLPLETGISELGWVQDFLVAALVVALITSMTSIILSASIARRQLTPLIETIEHIKGLEDGFKPMPESGADEIRRLGMSFNRMLGSLKRTTTSRDYLDRIFACMQDGIITIDDTGRIKTINNATETLFGYTREELIGQDVSILTPEEMHDAHKSYVQQSILYAPRVINETRLLKGKRKDGSIFDLELIVTPLGEKNRKGFVGLCRDITMRLKAEKALSDSEAKYRRIFETASEGFLYLDPLSGMIMDTNAALVKMTGYQKDELIGKEPGSFCTTDSRGRLSAFANRQEASSTSPIELSFICKNGDIRHVRYNLNYVLDPSGRPISQFAFLTDLTQEINVRQTLQDAREAAEDATKMKSEFLANMSHEIRTPMNGVIGMLDLISSTRLTKKQRDYVSTALKSADMQMSVINDILDYSKIEAGKLELESTSFSIRELLHDIHSLLAASADSKGLKLTCHISDELPDRYLGDPTRLRQVLINLAGNAIKFTDNGFVRLSCHEDGREAGNSSFTIKVEDSGIGISGDVIPHLFQPFSQADSSTTRKFGGTGLGLMISKSIIEAMNGQIGVNSVYGQGAEFWLKLTMPMLENADRGAAASELEEESQDFQGPLDLTGKRILLVEDTFINQQVALGILGSYGCKLDLAGDGFEAIDHYARNEYDLVLMDIQMPKLDGYEATKEIRAYEKDIGRERVPIIALTAHALKSDRELSLQNDMDDHLPKPVRKENLDIILRRWLQGDCFVAEQTRAAAMEPFLFPDIDLDLASLETLKGNLQGNQEELNRMIREFLTTVPELCAAMVTAIEQDDTVSRIRCAHSLKSCAATMGAFRLSEKARIMEHAENAILATSLKDCVRDIHQEFEAIRPRLVEIERTGAKTSGAQSPIGSST